ncbi:hypothetical protein GCM10022284_56990 [Streptomyces hundungensis]
MIGAERAGSSAKLNPVQPGPETESRSCQHGARTHRATEERRHARPQHPPPSDQHPAPRTPHPAPQIVEVVQ